MAQGASAVLLFGAVGAFALLPVPGRVAAPVVPEGGKTAEVPAPSGPGIDFAATKELMKIWDMKRAPEATDEGAKGPDRADVGKPGGPEWKYLGAIVEASRLVAIIESESGQRLVTPGASLDGMEVLEVRPDAIVVSEGTGKRTIELEARTGAVLGGAASIGIEHPETADHENEGEPGIDDPRAMDRRGPTGAKRPNGAGGKNMPRLQRPNPAGANPAGPKRPRSGQSDGT
jgi:hypothetical protein